MEARLRAVLLYFLRSHVQSDSKIMQIRKLNKLFPSLCTHLSRGLQLCCLLDPLHAIGLRKRKRLLCKLVVTFQSVDELLKCDDSKLMKVTQWYFPVVLFIMLYKAVLTFESMNEIRKCDH